MSSGTLTRSTTRKFREQVGCLAKLSDGPLVHIIEGLDPNGVLNFMQTCRMFKDVVKPVFPSKSFLKETWIWYFSRFIGKCILEFSAADKFHERNLSLHVYKLKRSSKERNFSNVPFSIRGNRSATIDLYPEQLNLKVQLQYNNVNEVVPYIYNIIQNALDTDQPDRDEYNIRWLLSLINDFRNGYKNYKCMVNYNDDVSPELENIANLLISELADIPLVNLPKQSLCRQYCPEKLIYIAAKLSPEKLRYGDLILPPYMLTNFESQFILNKLENGVECIHMINSYSNRLIDQMDKITKNLIVLPENTKKIKIMGSRFDERIELCNSFFKFMKCFTVFTWNTGSEHGYQMKIKQLVAILNSANLSEDLYLNKDRKPLSIPQCMSNVGFYSNDKNGTDIIISYSAKIQYFQELVYDHLNMN